MKKLVKSLIVIFIAVVVLFVSLFVKKSNTKSVSIAFYKTSTYLNTNIIDVITPICEANEIKVSFYTLQSGISLENQVNNKKYDIIITPDGASLNHAIAIANNKSSLNQSVTQEMFSTMKNKAHYNKNNVTALPLIIDHLEIDIDKQSFLDSGMKNINSWDDIEQFCILQQEYINNPMIFAGNNTIFFFDFIGALCEAHSGYDSYIKSVNIINSDEFKDNNFNEKELYNTLFVSDGAPLKETEAVLKQYYSNNFIGKITKDYVNYDIDVMAQDRRGRVIFTTLSDHRSFNASGISRYSSIYFPSNIAANNRHFTANVTFAVPVQNKEAVNIILKEIVSQAVQTELGRKTGLATVLANCRTPDKQADDVRYWVSATEPPLAGLGHDADLRIDQLDLLRNEILSHIIN